MADVNDDDVAPLRIEVEGEAPAPVIRLVGDLDIASADDLRRVVAQATAAGPERLVFDVEKLSFMDSSGLTVLLEAAAAVDHVVLRSPTEIVRRVIDTTGVSSILRTEP